MLCNRLGRINDFDRFAVGGGVRPFDGVRALSGSDDLLLHGRLGHHRLLEVEGGR